MKKTLKIAFVLLLFTLLPIIYFGLSCSIKENMAYKQIDKEYSALNGELLPVFLYLQSYKKQNGVYPSAINHILQYPNIFNKIEYTRASNGRGYFIEIYPVKSPIEYYYNDEFDNGYNYYTGYGSYDGFLDNENYYRIDKKFHAVTYDYFSRHNILNKFIFFWAQFLF